MLDSAVVQLCGRASEACEPHESPIANFDDLADFLKSVFDPPNAVSHFPEKLIGLRLKRNENMKAYNARFRTVLRRLREVSADAFNNTTLLTFYKKSLTPEIRQEVERLRPKTLIEAFRASLTAEKIARISAPLPSVESETSNWSELDRPKFPSPKFPSAPVGGNHQATSTVAKRRLAINFVKIHVRTPHNYYCKKPSHFIADCRNASPYNEAFSETHPMFGTSHETQTDSLPRSHLPNNSHHDRNGKHSGHSHHRRTYG
jgi:hypothetical protein